MSIYREAYEHGKSLFEERRRARSERAERALARARVKHRKRVARVIEGLPGRIKEAVAEGKQFLVVDYGFTSFGTTWERPRPASYLDVLGKELHALGFVVAYQRTSSLFWDEYIDINLGDLP